ncbi:helix-turn-helix domain-containing protein [Klebsiella aerogenes]
MSMELMVKAMKTKVGNPLRKLVLIKLADNANDKGECWPSHDHIANECEISRRSVISHIQALCDMGLLAKIKRRGQKINTSSLYRLTLESAGNAHLTGCAGNAHRCAGDSHQCAGAAHGCAGDAHRTSQEPVNEPKKTIDDAPASSAPMKNSDPVTAVVVRPGSAVQSPNGQKWGTDDDLRAAQWMFAKVQEVASATPAPNWAGWANDIRLARNALNVTHREICKVFAWANADHFWQTNILSPAKLRQKWPTLTAQMAQPSRQRQQQETGPHWNSAEAWEEFI